MDYTSIEELNEAFLTEEFEYTDQITVGDEVFEFKGSNKATIGEMMSGDFTGMVVFEGETDSIVFLYEFDENLSITPVGAESLNEAAKKKKKAKAKPKKKAKAKAKPAAKKSESKGPDIAGLKGNMKNTMDKHKIHLDKHIQKHGNVLKDLKDQLKTVGDAHKGDLEDTIKKVEDMLNGHREEMEKHASGHEERMKSLDDAYKELIRTHNDTSDRLGSDHSDRVEDLKATFDEFRDAHDEQMDHLKREHEMHRSSMKRDHEEHLKKIMNDHGDKLYDMKRDHGDKMFDMKRQHGEQLRSIQNKHEDRYRNTVKSHEENQEQMQQKHQTALDSVQQKHEESKIGTEAHVEIMNLHRSPAMKAKVDTGATICSLHADKMEVDRANGKVKFINKELSPHVISVPIASMSSVKSADGGLTYRPVILLNLRIKDKEIASVEVNLNDREHMTHPFLIGHNALEKGKFIIDPGYIGEGTEINFDYLQDVFREE